MAIFLGSNASGMDVSMKRAMAYELPPWMVMAAANSRLRVCAPPRAAFPRGRTVPGERRGFSVSLSESSRPKNLFWKKRTGTKRLCRAQQNGNVEDSLSKDVKTEEDKDELRIGSAVVVVEAPPYVKSAEPMPMMKLNNNIIRVGDAGRVLDRKPKNVWAIRFAVGSFLVDGKYFRPIQEKKE